jgi:hypothetical protein
VDDETVDEEVLEGQIYEESYQEYPDEFSHVEDPNETFDEDEVLISTLPFDEDIQAFIPPTNQEENMMSCNLFEYLDDMLFHEFGNREVLEEPLDEIDPFGKTQTKHPTLRIKSIMMKRQCKGMSIKRKNNPNEAQQVEILLNFLPLDEGGVSQTCLPPAHKDEEIISLVGANDLVQNLSNIVDLHIDDFI